MTKIRESARGETCTFHLEGICSYNREQTVLCHGPHRDKGMGIKGPDTWAAYGCYPCHLVADNRAHVFWQTFNFWQTWFWAICETQQRFMNKGLMTK